MNPSAPQPIDVLLRSLIRLLFHESNRPPLQPPPDKILAQLFGGVTLSAFSGYRQGKRRPVGDSPKSMAAAWAKVLLAAEKPEWQMPASELKRRLQREGFPHAAASDPRTLARVFEAALTSAKLLPRKSPPKDRSDEILSGRVPLKVSYLEYAPFCSYLGGSFFRQIVGNYIDSVGFNPEAQRRLPGEGKVGEQLREGECHIAACYFTSVSRSWDIRFFPLPMKASLGVICHRSYSHRIGNIQEMLRRDNPGLFAIVLKEEVGHLYARDREIPHVELEELGSTSAVHLLEAELKARTASAELELGDLIPVVIVDEHTAHQLLALMKGSAVSVLPTTDFGQSGYNFTDRNMPTYFMSIACGQSQFGLVRFLGESWPHYLRSEADRVGRALLDLFWETEKIVFEAAPYLEWWNPKTRAFESKWNPDTKTLVRPLKWIERRVLARQYALVNLSLDQHSIDATGLLPTYWTPLLRRTRRRLNNDWALRTAGGSVQEFVSHVFEDLPEEANPLMGRHRLWHRDQIKALNDYFNLPERLHLTEFRGLNRNEVVELIRRKLGEHESFREEIKVVEVRDALATAQAQMLLAQLADYYQSRQIRVYSKTSAALEQINTEDIALKIHAATEECSGEGGAVLLAQAVVEFLDEKDRGKPQPVGVIAIRVLRDLLKGSSEVVLEPEVEEELSASCELRFLWVHPHHRERGIGRLLIGTAIEWARARGYGYLRAAILPQLTFAIQLTLDQGFEPIDVPTSFDSDKSPHRRIFRLKLSR